MAEFQEVMKQWRRMCKMFSCSKCPLDEICSLDPQSRTDMEIATIEEFVIQWAEEHPEPVYPTWNEWFETFDEGIDVDEPIPTDIAQKLGQRPKEDT